MNSRLSFVQGWIVAGTWVAVVLFALVVLGFLSYEVSWKGRRLSADRARLADLIRQLSAVGTPARRPASHRQEER